MTKWIYRAVGTVGVAAGGALLLAGGAAQADGIDAPVNDLRGSLDGYFTPIGDLPGGGGDLFSSGGGTSTKDLAPTQQLGFLAAVPSSPTAGVDPTALEAGTGAGQLSADDLSLLSVGDKKIGMDSIGNALGSIGPLSDSPAAGGTTRSAPALPALGDGPLDLGLDKVAGGPAPTAGSLGEDELTGAVSSTLSEDNLNTIGSDSQMRTLGSTVDADQLADFGSLGRQAGLGDLGRGGPSEAADDPLGAVGKHAAPDPSDFAIAGLKADSLDEVQSFVRPLIGEALEAQMPPGFLGEVTEADPNSNALGLPLIGQLPVDALSTSGNLPVLGSLTSPGGGSAPAGGTAAQPAAQTPAAQTPAAKQAPAQVPAQSRQPSVSPTPDAGASDNQRAAHRQWSRSSSERPVAGADSDFH